MNNEKRITRVIGAVMLLAGTALLYGLFIHPVLAFEKELTKADKVKTEALGGRKRYLSHVSTDKPIYRIGEPAYVRAVVLNALDRKPFPGSVGAVLEIIGPKGDTVASGRSVLKDGAAGFRWIVPEGQAGGEYTAKVIFPDWNTGFCPSERKFDIRAYRAPRLKTQIEFLRDGYGPGDTVKATCSVKRAEGGVPEAAKVTVQARVDGKEVYRGKTGVSAEGLCSTTFQLPGKIVRGEGTLLFVIEDGGTVETAAKSIPILLQTVDVKIYPEGGDLVAGLPNRVYFEARTPAKKPADIAGEVVDGAGKKVAEFRSVHEGRGKFSFTPAAGEKYSLKITEPAGIRTEYPLPDVKNAGFVIRAAADVIEAGKPVVVKVGCTGDRTVLLTVCQRETELASRKFEVKGGELVESSIQLNPGVAGVLVVTLWDEKDRPLAERLVFRRPNKKLKVSVSLNKKNPTPGDPVELTVKVTDETGKPVGAVVGITVTDDSVQEMMETRDKAPRLPAMVYLEPEVKELADTGKYLDPKDPESSERIDLLLGTQGWRRFAFLKWKDFLSKYGDDARRVMAFKVVRHRERLAVEKMEADGAIMAEGIGLGMAGAHNGMMVKAAAKAMPPQVPEAMPMAAPEDRTEVALENKPRPGAGEMRDAMVEALDAAEEPDVIGKRKQLARRAAPVQQFAFRVYAHPRRKDWKPDERIDFTETLYWAAAVKTNPETGEAKVSFALNDAVSSFRAFADAYDVNGALGCGDMLVKSVRAFHVEPKLPLEVTAGDKVILPVTVANNTASALPASVDFEFAGKAGKADLQAPAFSKTRTLREIIVPETAGDLSFSLKAAAGAYSDSISRRLKVAAGGFPVAVEYGGMVGPNKPMEFNVNVPDQVEPGSLGTNVAVYPTPLANLTDALQALIRDPSGCFEQTSSSNYPLVMAQQYFVDHTGINPELIRRSREKLDKGYKRLVGFECPEKGYEWFGGDPGHEALTAYGLMEFMDMRQVMEVDDKMIARTRDWLMNRRDGKGGFERNPRALDSFGGAPQDTTDAYITWTLVESGMHEGIDKELAHLEEIASGTADSYVVALAANVFAKLGKKDIAAKFMEKLVAKQDKDGRVTGAEATITRSGGESKSIETTSLALLAWMQNERFAGNVEKSMRFLVDSCKSGRFGSTQGTILALRAIVTYDKLRARPKAPGSVQLYVDGKAFGKKIKFDEKTQGAIELPSFVDALPAGKHRVQVRMFEGSDMPFSLSVKYNSPKPASSDKCRLELAVKLSNPTVAEGEGAEVMVTVKNRTAEVLPTPIAIIGIPGGLEPRHDQLKELVKSGKIDAYEVIGREVVCYWRCLKENAEVSFPVSCIAAVPGTYTAPASRSYEYYTPENKNWVAGVKVDITPRR